MRTENEQTLVVLQELLVLVLPMPVDLLVFGLDTVVGGIYICGGVSGGGGEQSARGSAGGVH